MTRFPADKVVATATKGGHTGMVHEVYDSLFFSPYLSFPLEGKCHVVVKGCTGECAVMTLHRGRGRRKAACCLLYLSASSLFLPSSTPAPLSRPSPPKGGARVCGNKVICVISILTILLKLADFVGPHPAAPDFSTGKRLTWFSGRYRSFTN